MNEEPETPLIAGQEEEEESNHLVQKHKSTGKIIFHALIACMGSFFFGYSLGELNMAQPTLDYKYGIGTDIDMSTDLADGLITGAMPLGAAFGCIVAGQMLKRMSRRSIFYICDFSAIVISGLFILKSFYLAVFLRLAMGFIVGINSTAVPLYLREISPVSISGVIGIMNQGFLNLGIVTGYILGLGFPLNPAESGDFFWRFVLAFPIITSVIRILGITLIYTEDTALFYLYHDHTEKAKEVVSHVYKEEYQEEILEHFQHDADHKKETHDTWSLVFSQSYRSRLLLGSMVSFFQQFSGINAIVFYSTTIFQNCLGDQQLANQMTVVSGLVLMAFSFMSGIFTKKFGRKPILMVGEVVLMCTLVGTGVVSLLSKDQVEKQDVSTPVTVLIIGLVFLYEIGFSLSIGPLAWVYNADILNSEKALGFATALNQTSAFIIGLVFPSVQASLGIYTTFFIFAGFCLLGLIYFNFKLKETRGLTQKQIVRMFVDLNSKQDQSLQALNNESSYDN